MSSFRQKARRLAIALMYALNCGAAVAGSDLSGGAVNRVALQLVPPLEKMTTPSTTLEPRPFSELPGWDRDNHLAAWSAFVGSCQPVLASARGNSKSGARRPPQGLLDACELALLTERSGTRQTKLGAREFFERHFTPHAVTHSGPSGLLTGYYEPLVAGSRVADATYSTPVYRRPADLENVVAESERGATSKRFTHMRRTDGGLVPHLTRAEIEQGALEGQNLELLYFKDPVDVFFMQIQGSARVELPTGERIRITYDGKNGYPYTSIGKALIAAGDVRPENMSLKSLGDWLRADRERGRRVMWKNESYVFFRELQGEEADGAMGVMKIRLQPGRSLAVDTAFHAIGTPIYISAPTLTHAGKRDSGGFHRLMIAQDVGSAIKGPERGDIYFGSGDQAGRVAGVTKHPGVFYVLAPRDAAIADAATAGSTGSAR